jgi:hypothetical protein
MHVDLGRSHLTSELQIVTAEILESEKESNEDKPKSKPKKKTTMTEKDKQKLCRDKNIIKDFEKGYNAPRWFKKHYNVSADYVKNVIFKYKINMNLEFKFKENRSSPTADELDYIKKYFLLETNHGKSRLCLIKDFVDHFSEPNYL